VADDYARSRPTYPAELYAWLAAVTPRHDLAWDCGCGSGQATAGLLTGFRQVIATDASAAQIANAPELPGVEWRVAHAEESGLETHSVDAVIIAQALHWFDIPAFWNEVNRVVRPGGVVMTWSYAFQQTGDATLDALLREFTTVTLGGHWPPERRHVDAGYTTINFPFEQLVPPAAAMTAVWDVGRELGYLRSWSATRRAREVLGTDPVGTIEEQLRQAWGNGEREVQWPLTVLAGVVGR
jgi:SAM-dependent methyltransferase